MWVNPDGHCGGGVNAYSSLDKEDYIEEKLKIDINTDDRVALDKLFRKTKEINFKNNGTDNNLSEEKDLVYIDSKVIGIAFIKLALVVPTELILIDLSISISGGGPIAWILELPLAVLEVIVADFGISLGIQARETLVTRQDVKFQWTIIPALISDLPKPIQNDIQKFFPYALP